MCTGGTRPHLRLKRKGIFETARSSHVAKTPFHFSRPLTVNPLGLRPQSWGQPVGRSCPRLVPPTAADASMNRNSDIVLKIPQPTPSGKPQRESGRPLPSIQQPAAHTLQLIILVAGQPPETRFSWPGKLQPANEAATSQPVNLSPTAFMPDAGEKSISHASPATNDREKITMTRTTTTTEKNARS